MMAGTRLGLVCGLKSEREAFCAGAGEAAGSVLIGVSGARPDRAQAETRRLIAEGATVLVSFGLAGALDPKLAPGALLLPETVVTEAGDRWGADAERRARLGLVCTADGAAALGAEAVIDTAAAKSALWTSTGAAAVDMESHRVAAVAAEAGLPLLVVRAVADPADRALPPAAASAVDEAGGVRVLATLAGVARRPGDLAALLALKGDSDAGLKTLREAAARVAALA